MKTHSSAERDMSPSQQVALKVIEVLEAYAERRAHFTVPQLRRLAGIEAEGSLNAHLWNLWRSLEEAEVVEELPTGRKRNRIFRVAKPERLEVFRPVSGENDLERLKESDPHIDPIELRLRRIEMQLAELAEGLKELSQ